MVNKNNWNKIVNVLGFTGIILGVVGIILGILKILGFF